MSYFSGDAVLRQYPVFSVVIPTYNREKFLARCLESVYSQDFKGAFEVVVVDDASTDGTGKMMLEQADAHRNLIYVRNKRRGCCALMKNMGYNVATGKYISYIDDDDIWLPRHLSALYERFEETGCPFARTLSRVVDANGEDVKWKFSSPITSSCLAHRRDALKNFFREVPFNVAQPPRHPGSQHDDWYFYLDFKTLGMDSVVNEVTVLYTRHSDNMSEAA